MNLNVCTWYMTKPKMLVLWWLTTNPKYVLPVVNLCMHFFFTFLHSIMWSFNILRFCYLVSHFYFKVKYVLVPMKERIVDFGSLKKFLSNIFLIYWNTHDLVSQLTLVLMYTHTHPPTWTSFMQPQFILFQIYNYYQFSNWIRIRKITKRPFRQQQA